MGGGVVYPEEGFGGRAGLQQADNSTLLQHSAMAIRHGTKKAPPKRSRQ